MKISVLNQKLQVEEFSLSSGYETEIADHFSTLSEMERSAVLSKMIEIGWIVSRMGSAQMSSDHFERATQRWASRISYEFKESGLEMFEDFAAGMALELGQLKEALLVDRSVAQRTAVLADKTTIKGFNFESTILESLSALASSRSDLVTYVGNHPGADGAKKGDFVYEMSSVGQSIAIEAKDFSSKFSVQKIDELIAGAIKNRGTQFGIFVVKDSACLPECFGAFYLGKNYIACGISHLEMAIKVAAVIVGHNRNLNFDLLDMKRFVDAVKQEIGTIDEIIKSSNASKKAAHKSEELARSLKESLELKMECFLSTEKGGLNDERLQ